MWFFINKFYCRIVYNNEVHCCQFSFRPLFLQFRLCYAGCNWRDIQKLENSLTKYKNKTKITFLFTKIRTIRLNNMMIRRGSRHAHQRRIDVDVHFAVRRGFFLRVDFFLQQLVKVMDLFAVLMRGRHRLQKRVKTTGW